MRLAQRAILLYIIEYIQSICWLLFSVVVLARFVVFFPGFCVKLEFKFTSVVLTLGIC